MSAAPRCAEPPPEACTTISAATVEGLVPGAKTPGTELKTRVVARRTGCSWHALDCFDYRWPASLPSRHFNVNAASPHYPARLEPDHRAGSPPCPSSAITPPTRQLTNGDIASSRPQRGG
jgi:hypothetical protein